MLPPLVTGICRNAAVRVLDEVRVRHIERLGVVEVAVLKDAQHLFHAQLAVLVVADVLDAIGKFFLLHK